MAAKKAKIEKSKSKVDLKMTDPKSKADFHSSESKINRPSRLNIKGIRNTLSVIFYTLWIIIGIFLLVVIVQSFRQGAFASLFASPQTPPATDNSQANQTVIPGIGLVDVSCVQQALPQDAIQKIVSSGDSSKLTSDEKDKLKPCLIQAESPSPSPAASPSK